MNLVITTYSTYIEFIYDTGERKTLTLPFILKLINDKIYIWSAINKLDDYGFYFSKIDSITINSVIQNTALETYNTLKLLSGNSVNIVSESGNKVGVNDSGQMLVVLDGKVSDDNSSNTPLLADDFFIGVSCETLDYAIIFVSVFSDVASAENGLIFQTSSDNITWRDSDVYTVDSNSDKTFSFQPNRKYIRVKYINGSSNQTVFDLQTILKKTNSKPSSHRIQDSISSDDDAELTKSVLTGLNPNKVFQNVNTNILGNLLVSLDEQKDAFGRLKIAEPFTIFDSSLTDELADTLFWSELKNVTGNSVYDRTMSKKTLTTTVTGDYVVRQTRQRFKYQPAKSHEFFITGLLSTETGQRKRCGLVDYDNVNLATITNAPQNGVYFENNAGILSWNIVNNGTITESATQANWNLDKCDGTGKSGFSLDINAANIFTCQLEWLGVGVVLVGFATSMGNVIYCHGFMHASLSGFTDVYMRTANLPISYEITSTDGSGSMKAICSSVISGGGFNPVGDTHAVFNAADVAISSGNTELLIGIRLKAEYFEYTIDPKNLSILSLGNGNTQWVLCINPTYSGAVTWVDEPNSVVQKAINNNNIVSDYGKIIAAGSFSNNTDSLTTDIESSKKIGKGLDDSLDELWLIATALGNESYRGTINFKQLI